MFLVFCDLSFFIDEVNKLIRVAPDHTVGVNNLEDNTIWHKQKKSVLNFDGTGHLSSIFV